MSRDIIYAFDFIAKLLRLPLALIYARAFGAGVGGRSDLVEFTLQIAVVDEFDLLLSFTSSCISSIPVSSKQSSLKTVVLLSGIFCVY